MVIIWHYANAQGAAQLSPLIAHLMHATSLSWSGVDLFFVLSGFLIGGILIDKSEQPGFLRTFYIRRAARILPLYTVLVTSFFLLRSFLNHESFGWLFGDGVPDFSYLTFTQNIFMGINNSFGGHFLGVTWSLAVEEQFYLFVPITLLLIGRANFPKAILILALIAPLLRLWKPGFLSVVNTPFRMDSLLIGVGLALAFRSESFVSYLNRSKKMVWCVFLILLIGMISITIGKAGHGFLDPSIIAAFYAVFITIALIYRDSKITALLRSGVLVRLGLYSYGLYMFHQMVAGLIHGYFRSAAPSLTSAQGILLTVTSLIITGLLSCISYHTYEIFFLRMGRHFSYDVQHKIQKKV